MKSSKRSAVKAMKLSRPTPFALRTIERTAFLTLLCGALYEYTTSPQTNSYESAQRPQSLLLVVEMLGLPHYWQTLQTRLWFLKLKALKSLYLHWELTLSPTSASPTLNYLPSSETLRCLLLQVWIRWSLYTEGRAISLARVIWRISSIAPFNALKSLTCQCLVCEANGSDIGALMILCYWFNILF